ncbi:MAG: ABC transporter permease [Trueperaceae bacterium]|nr:ABC transporter permease [Trueperaceae bacterium]
MSSHQGAATVRGVARSSRAGQGRSARHGLGPIQVFLMAWRSLSGNVMRSVLTTLGIIIGVASVVALTAVGTGVNAGVEQSITNLGTNLLTVSGSFGGFGGGLVRGGPRQSVTVADAEAIRDAGWESVAALAPVVQTNSQLKNGSLNVNATVIGTWPEFAEVRNTPPESGTFFSQADVDGRNRVVVLGSDIASELFPDGSAIGGTVKIVGVSYTVLGILPDKGAGGNSTNSNVLIPLSTYLQRVGRSSAVGQPTVQSVYVQARSADDLKTAQTLIENLLDVRHGTQDTRDFQVQNQGDVLASFSEITGTLTLFLGSVAGISLLVGGIGIMNIMLVSVTERTREIGIRKALGAKPRDILAQFLTESSLLSVGGGLIGIGLGLLLAFVVLPRFGLNAVATPGSMIVAFGFSAFVGVFFGFYPARRAASLDPVDALRYE